MLVGFKRILGLIALSSLGLSGCDEEAIPVDTSPQVTHVDSLSLVIGEPMSFYGMNFLQPGEGRTTIVFSHPDDGGYEYVNDQGQLIREATGSFTIAPIYDGSFPAGGTLVNQAAPIAPGTEVLRWSRFGPFDVPFSNAASPRPGTFKGYVHAVNEYVDGTTEVGEPIDVEIVVKPSILIRVLEPVVEEGERALDPECEKNELRPRVTQPQVIERDRLRVLIMQKDACEQNHS